MMRDVRGHFLLLIFAFFSSFLDASDAQTELTEVALFYRCYSHLTNHRPPINHPLRLAVIAGTKTAVDACMELITAAELNTSGGSRGYLKNLSDPDPQVVSDAIAVLKTMNDFFRTWFTTDNIPANIPFGEDEYPHTQDVYDGSEPALHLTRALLWPGTRFSEVVTGSYSIEALRSGGVRYDDKLIYSDGKRFLNGVTYGDETQSAAFAGSGLPLKQLGILQGLLPLNYNATKLNFQVRPASNFVSIDYPFVDVATSVHYQGLSSDVPLNESLGGGIIGTRSYLMMNLGRLDFERMNGGVRMPRRWAKNILKDLLCRDIPTIRLGDAAPFVQSAPTAETPPFRGNRNCMQCHATMDNIAASARNVSYVTVPYAFFSNGESGHRFVTIKKWDATWPRESAQADEDYVHYTRPPFGRLFYRSYDGSLVNKEVNGIQGLGDAISGKGDLYVCAASRLFFFFTGIGANIQDPGDPRNASLSAADKEYRAFVIQLGLALKNSSDQNLQTVIRSILESSYYRRTSMRSEKDEGGQ